MVALVRCDDRLIHGQCVVRIVKDFSVDKIVVADDFVAGNQTLKTICELAAPSGVEAKVVTTAEAAKGAAGYAASPERVLLLMKSPETALTLFKACGELPRELNIGPMSSSPGAKKMTFYCHLTEAEQAAAQELSDMGVRVYFNQVIDQPAVEWGQKG